MLEPQTKINIDHIVLRVSDFSSARTFYGKLFACCLWEEIPDPGSDSSVGFRSGAGFTLWLAEVPDLSTGNRAGWLDHVALHCESREAVDEMHMFCRAQEWTILSEPQSYPDYGTFYGFSFQGPDGIKLEFVTR